jgi:CTP:molybdopterin cytidylyltransferase MocA
MAIEGDVGARNLINRYGEAVVEVPVTSKGALVDVDTPEALRGVKAAIEGA